MKGDVGMVWVKGIGWRFEDKEGGFVWFKGVEVMKRLKAFLTWNGLSSPILCSQITTQWGERYT